MPTVNLVKPNRYQDSVTLMQVAVKLRDLAGVDDASLMMGTEPNKEMLEEAHLLAAEGRAAGPNDLIIALSGDVTSLQGIEAQVETLMKSDTSSGGEKAQQAPHTLSAGIEALPGANLA